MTPEKQKLLEELLSGAKDTGLKGKLASFNPEKPYGQRFEVESSGNVFTDGEVGFDNFSLGQQVQIYKGSAVPFIFSSNKLIDKAKVKQSQKQPRRLASEKRSKKPTVVKAYDPKKGYLVTEGSSEYPNCRSITNGAIAIGAIVVRKGNLIDQMRIRPGATALAGATPGNKIKYLYTGPTIDGVQSLYAAGWKPNLSIKIRDFKDGWVLSSALIDNLGGNRFLCSLVAKRQTAPNQVEYLCEYYDGSTLQWSLPTPFAPTPYGYGFFTGKDQEQVCKVADGEVLLLSYDSQETEKTESWSTSFYTPANLMFYSQVSIGEDGGIFGFIPISVAQGGDSGGSQITASSASYPGFLSPFDRIENSSASQSASQSNSIARENTTRIGATSEYPGYGYNINGFQRTETLTEGYQESSFTKSSATQPNRWNANLETYIAASSQSMSSSSFNSRSASGKQTFVLNPISQTVFSGSGIPTISKSSNSTSKSAYLRNASETDVKDPAFSTQGVRAKTVEDSAEIEIVSGAIAADQYFYGSAFPANSIILSVNGSRAEANTKAIFTTKDEGNINERSTPLSWVYQPTTANTDILKEGLAQIQGSAYTSDRLTHNYTENAVPKTQDVARLAKEAIEIIVPLYDKKFLYERIDRAKVFSPELATITAESGALSFGFLNGSYSP